MPPPVAVYVAAAVLSVAAVFAFKEFVYEPHIAPKIEAWAEDFLERRRAARNRRASAVPVSTTRRRRRPRRDTFPSDSSHHSDDVEGVHGGGDGASELNEFAIDGFQLEALASKEVDEWRNEVLRSQEMTRDGLRRRRTDRRKDDFDGFNTTSTTLDESFTITSLTHTPLASTHVISNVSSPMTPSTVSLPSTPTHRLRSVSESTTTQEEVVATHSPIRDIPVMSPTSPSTATTPRPSSDVVNHADASSPSPLAIPVAVRYSSVNERVPHPLPFTPTYQVIPDDSPFGPLLPDTPRSSAEMYGERPFSPITRVMSSSSYASANGSKEALSSRVDSTNSVRTLGGSGVLRKRSGLVNEVTMSNSDDDGSGSDHQHPPVDPIPQPNPCPVMHESVISSLSERYPAPPTPPVIVSPPASSVGVISAPSSPRSSSGSSAVVVGHHTVPSSQARSALPSLQLPSDTAGSLAPTTLSPAASHASFASFPYLSPMIPISRIASVSESEGVDEFLSVASDESDDWPSASSSGLRAPVPDRANNPFLDFEHVAAADQGRASVGDGEGSEAGSEIEIVVPPLPLGHRFGHEGGSEASSDESWGSARRR